MKTFIRSAQEQLQIVSNRRQGSPQESLYFEIDLLDSFLHGFLPNELIVIYGSSSSYALTDFLICKMLLRRKADPEENIVYIDGGNCFNLNRISNFARQQDLGVKESLKRIHVSRAFTSHQLATLIVRELSHEIELHPSRLIVISDLLSIARDEEIGDGEAKDMLNRAACRIRDLTTDKRVITLLPNSRLATSKEQQSLETFLWPKSDIILQLRELKHRTRFFRKKHPLGEGQVDFDLSSLHDSLQQEVILEQTARNSFPSG